MAARELARSAWTFAVTVTVAIALALGGKSSADANHAADLARGAARQAAQVAEQAKWQSQVAAEQARRSCRTRLKYGPDLAKAYLRYRILTREQVKAYRQEIPESC